MIDASYCPRSSLHDAAGAKGAAHSAAPPSPVLAVRPAAPYLRAHWRCHFMIAAMGVLISRLHFRGGQPYQLFMLFPIPPGNVRGEAAAPVISRARPIVKPGFFNSPHPHVVYSHLHPLTRGRLPYFLLIESNKETKVPFNESTGFLSRCRHAEGTGERN